MNYIKNIILDSIRKNKIRKSLENLGKILEDDEYITCHVKKY